MSKFAWVNGVVFDRVAGPDHLGVFQPGIEATIADWTSIGMLVDIPFT